MKARTYDPALRRLPEVRALRDAIEAVSKSYGPGLARHLCADAMADHFVETWQSLGLVRARGHICYRWLSEGRCRGGKDCPGLGHGALDHEAGFLDPTDRRPLVIIANTYDFEGAPMRELHALCEKHSVNPRFTARSTYFPGATLQIELWHPRARVPRWSP